MTINIGSRGTTDTERLLSNFAPTPFTLHGEVYASVEGFWQSLKFPKPEDRKRVAQLTGAEAKRAGRDAPRAETFIYRTVRYRIGTPEHHGLMRAALRAKLRQNPDVLKLLLQTGDEQLTHVLHDKEGKELPDSRTIPGAVFAGFLMELREEFRAIHGTGEHLITGGAWR